MSIPTLSAFWTRNSTYGKFGSNPKYRCPSERLADGEFSGGCREPCDGCATRDGIVGGCGEPCTFVMHNPYSSPSQ